MYKALALYLMLPFLSCEEAFRMSPVETDSISFDAPAFIERVVPDTIIATKASVWQPKAGIKAGDTDPAALIEFSKTLKGIPYKYAASDPANGFDCSGFITYVFNHFGVGVPRTSVDFTNQGTPVDLQLSKPGDLILFTGTDSTIRIVGHMGIITQTGDSIVFIHATSGKANAVTETTLNPYYMGRFMKVIRVLQ
jgi:cell wall-associated NlpC family hydrolase